MSASASCGLPPTGSLSAHRGGDGRAARLDPDLDLVHKLQPKLKRYRPLRRFPASAFDLSVVAGLRELSGDIQKQLVAHAGGHLESIEFLRQYTGPPLPEGKQSLSCRLTVYAPDHTLLAEEVSAIRPRIIDGIKAAGYELRLRGCVAEGFGAR